MNVFEWWPLYYHASVDYPVVIQPSRVNSVAFPVTNLLSQNTQELCASETVHMNSVLLAKS